MTGGEYRACAAIPAEGLHPFRRRLFGLTPFGYAGTVRRVVTLQRMDMVIVQRSLCALRNVDHRVVGRGFSALHEARVVQHASGMPLSRFAKRDMRRRMHTSWSTGAVKREVRRILSEALQHKCSGEARRQEKDTSGAGARIRRRSAT